MSWPRRRVVPHNSSRLSRRAIARVGAAEALCSRLVQTLPALAHERDPVVLAGACLAWSSLYGGLLHADMLGQVLDPGQSLCTHEGLAWIDLRLGRPEARWEGVRRWFPDPMCAYLRGQYLIQLRLRRQAPPAADTALKALERTLDVPVPTLAQLVKTAHARFATQLPAFMHEYLVNPSLAISLTPPDWQRLLTGKPLNWRSAPPAAEVAHLPWLGAPLGVTASPSRHRAPVRDGVALAKALRALKACLRLADGKDRKLGKAGLRKRLETWRTEHGEVGGWVAWLAAWVEHRCLRTAQVDTVRRRQHIPTVLRYLDGFADRFIAALRDLPPGEIADAPEALAERLTQLRDEVLTLQSAGVATAGLRQFLGFVAHAGGPVIELDSEWSAMIEAREARGRIVTLCEYARLQSWLGTRFPARSFPLRRARTMAALAFRLGLRWEEVRGLRFKDVSRFYRWEGPDEIWIRATAHADRKSVSSVRKLPLRGLLTEQEIDALAGLLKKTVDAAPGPHAPNHYLFADPGDPTRPPALEDTHDAIQDGLRWASGDATLVFHDLRHAAANFALLRLLDDGSGQLGKYVPGLSELQALTDPGLSLAAYLTGRGPKDAARLYALSELMGHLDPGVTLRHYVHLLDLVVGLTLHSQVTLPPSVEARLGEVRVASIRKRRYRRRKAKSE